MTEIGQAALLYASRGIPIFPCIPNGKPPATPGGFKDATTDPQQIERWWTEDLYRNLAFCPDDVGLLVADADGSLGLLTWDGLQRLYGAEPVIIVSTPSGGRHYYFKGRLNSSVKKVAPGVDIRGVGGYVLLPPSVINGVPYTFILKP